MLEVVRKSVMFVVILALGFENELFGLVRHFPAFDEYSISGDRWANDTILFLPRRK